MIPGQRARSRMLHKSSQAMDKDPTYHAKDQAQPIKEKKKTQQKEPLGSPEGALEYLLSAHRHTGVRKAPMAGERTACTDQQ